MNEKETKQANSKEDTHRSENKKSTKQFPQAKKPVFHSVKNTKGRKLQQDTGATAKKDAIEKQNKATVQVQTTTLQNKQDLAPDTKKSENLA